MTARREPPLPDKVKVGPLTYDIARDTLSHILAEHEVMDSVYGTCDLKKQAIVISPEATGGRARSTLVHEVLHALLYTSGLKISDAKEEQIIRALQDPLLGVLRDNPALVTYLTGGTA